MSVSGCCRRRLRLLSSILLLFNVYSTIANAQTPVIGGLCKLGVVDVPIGGKQTQFYLKCESGEGSDEGYGIWMVKSRATTNDETTTTTTKSPREKSFCDRDNTIREGNTCEHSANCLQPHQDELASYYQCDANSRWMRRSCTNRLLFSFDHQACVGIETTTMAGKTIAHEPMNHHSDVTISFTNGNNNNNNGDDGNDPFAHRGVHRQYPSSSSSGSVVCTFSGCSNSNGCSSGGSCNNGYCCSTGTLSAAIVPTNSGGCSSGGCSSCTSGCPRGYSGCCGTQQASCCMLQLCPGGVQSTGRSCYNSCPSGQSCISGVCCPSLSCPNGGSSTGSCSNNGYCNQGSICIQSLGVCCPSTNTGTSSTQYSCPNGGQAVGQCVNGACGSGYSCNYGTNLCCGGISISISNQNQFSCSDGTQAAGACIQGLCGTGFTCINNLCCRGLNNSPRCLDGTNPLGTCLNGLCPTNYMCTTGNLCCAANTCTSGVSLGTCISGLCPNGYTCISNQCCPSTTTASTTTACPNNLAAIGPCVNNGCPVGYACLTASNSCCPSTTTTTCSDGSTPIGVCIGGACPTGYTCTNNVCCVTAGTTTTCPAATPVFQGPCIGGICPSGQTCVGGTICCSAFRLHRHPSIDSDPDMIYGGTGVSIFGGQLSECPNGQEPIGQCINGICGIGYSCMDNTCCPNDLMTGNNLNVCPNGQPGVGACFMGGVCGTGFTCDTRTNLCCSIANGNINGNSVVATVCTDGSAPLGTCPTGQNTCPTGYVCEGTICCRLTTSMNIGSRCEYPQQCAGFAQGLATCVDFTCRCQPLAYVQGVACVRRRKSLRLKFQDASAIDTDEMKKINATSST